MTQTTSFLFGEHLGWPSLLTFLDDTDDIIEGLASTCFCLCTCILIWIMFGYATLCSLSHPDLFPQSLDWFRPLFRYWNCNNILAHYSENFFLLQAVPSVLVSELLVREIFELEIFWMDIFCTENGEEVKSCLLFLWHLDIDDKHNKIDFF